MLSSNQDSMKSQIISASLKACPAMKYLYFVPNNKRINNTIVLIHGISRNAIEIIETFTKLANENNCLLIAPIFSKQHATDYQRLGRIGKGPRADYLLMSVINEVNNTLNIESNPYDLFGFSAGAQFAHRFAFAYPTEVKKVALVAAGWYTLPIENIDYPIGLKLTNQFNDITFEPLRFLRTKLKVFIGENDIERKKGFNTNKIIDELQGENRRFRASFWVELMNQSCQKYNIQNNITLEILKGVGHDFMSCELKGDLSEKVYQWFNQS